MSKISSLEVRGVHLFSNKLWPNQQFVDVGVYIFHPTKKQIQHFVLLYITYPICKTFSIEHSSFSFFPQFLFKGLTKNKGNENSMSKFQPYYYSHGFFANLASKKFMAKCLILLDILVV
jgi:hypothetical protein